MSGQGKYRNLWEHYYEDCQAIVFVIDSSDKFRLVVVKDELCVLLSHPNIKKAKTPLLFFANKMDIANAASKLEIAQTLELDNIADRAWHITESSAITGDGLDEGITWLTEQLTKLP
eukprot:TRINITY_DN2671_c0_g1_i2.p2 TRINITY_DN2671_c0_g1~~TRINITY_DN2671_c0_g1_i2.p2  ORF type:complete len:117 (+),score=16.45 TRINITY_DN2671_c0_g1_i2:431-781(+)